MTDVIESEANEVDINADMIVPQHIAIIMDGNGRWAQQRGKLRVVGHKKGVESVRKIVKVAREKGIKALTLFAFSSENWQRPEKEVSVLMDLFMFVLTREIKRMKKHDIRFQVIGDTSRFSDKLQTQIREAELLTVNNSGLVLSVAANYGGRWDITQAAKSVAEACLRGEMKSEDINESSLASHLMLSDRCDPDLFIRTGGEMRISNFLL